MNLYIFRFYKIRIIIFGIICSLLISLPMVTGFAGTHCPHFGWTPITLHCVPVISGQMGGDYLIQIRNLPTANSRLYQYEFRQAVRTLAHPELFLESNSEVFEADPDFNCAEDEFFVTHAIPTKVGRLDAFFTVQRRFKWDPLTREIFINSRKIETSIRSMDSSNKVFTLPSQEVHSYWKCLEDQVALEAEILYPTSDEMIFNNNKTSSPDSESSSVDGDGRWLPHNSEQEVLYQLALHFKLVDGYRSFRACKVQRTAILIQAITELKKLGYVSKLRLSSIKNNTQKKIYGILLEELRNMMKDAPRAPNEHRADLAGTASSIPNVIKRALYALESSKKGSEQVFSGPDQESEMKSDTVEESTSLESTTQMEWSGSEGENSRTNSIFFTSTQSSWPEDFVLEPTHFSGNDFNLSWPSF